MQEVAKKFIELLKEFGEADCPRVENKRYIPKCQQCQFNNYKNLEFGVDIEDEIFTKKINLCDILIVANERREKLNGAS